MASPNISGTTCSGSMSSLENLAQTDVRKRKRMLSNRESARRSRMRKQKLLDDLTVQMNNLRAENNHILTNMNLVTHLLLNMESENSVLRAQMSELNHRLHALNELSSCFSSNADSAPAPAGSDQHHADLMINDDFLNPWSLIHVHHPIMASPDHVFLY